MRALIRTSLPEQVFHRLVSDVLAGRYAPGERLPTQRALAAELGVNMASLREGVKRLEQLGLVDVRHGDAMRVLDWRLHGGPDVLVHLIARAGVARRRDGALGDGGAAAAARRVRPAGRGAAHRRAGGAARLARRAARGARSDDAAPAPRLRLLRGADRGGRQRRLPARHELDPGAVPREPRALPPDRGLGRAARYAGRRAGGRARATATRAAARSRGSPPPRRRGCWRRCREGPLPPRGVDLRRAHRRRRDARAAAAAAWRATDAVAGFDAWLAARAAGQPRRDPRRPARARHPPARPRPRRARRRAARPRATRARRASRSCMEALRAAAAAAYYGDDGVMRRLGYDAGERVRRGAEVRAAAPRRPDAPEGPPERRRHRRPGSAHLRRRRRRRCAPTSCVIGSGAGGAVVAKELAEAGTRVVLLEEGAARRAPSSPRARATCSRASIATPRSTRRSAARRSCSRSAARSAARRSSTPAPASARPTPCWRAGATEFGLDDLRRRSRRLRARRARARRRARSRPSSRAPTRTSPGAAPSARLVGRLRAPQRRAAASARASAPSAARRTPSSTSASPTSRRPHAAGATTYTRRERAADRAPRPAPPASSARPPAAGACASTRRASSSPPARSTRPRCSPPTASATHRLGRHLSLHPATAAWAMMDEVVDMARGVPQSYFIDEFAADGVMLEGIAGPPDYLAMGLPVAGERHRELMEGYRHVAQFGLMISRRLARARALARRPARSSATTSPTPTPRGQGRPRAPRRAVLRRRRARVLLPLAASPRAARRRLDPAARRAAPGPQADGLPPARQRAHGRAARATASSTPTGASTAPRASTSATAAPSRPRSASTRRSRS